MEFNFDFNLDTEEDKNRIMIPKKFKKPQLIKFEKAVEMSKKIVIEKDSHIFAIVSGNFIYGDLIEAIVVENNANILEMTISTLSMSESNINSLAILLENEDEKTEGLTDADEIPEEVEPTVKLGQIWKLGNHKIMCGDSTKKEDVEKLMGGEKADMVFTDPPYGVNYQSNMRIVSKKFDVLKNDDVILDITPIIKKFSKGWIFVWTSWKIITKWIDLFTDFDYPTNQIIWFKGGGGIGDLKKTFSSDYETALVWHRGAFITGKRLGSVWQINKDGSSKYVHPTQKPVELPIQAISNTTNKNDIVFDLFLGSGSTLIACEKTNRRCFGMELDPKYCDVIITRWQNFTGKKAKLINA